MIPMPIDADADVDDADEPIHYRRQAAAAAAAAALGAGRGLAIISSDDKYKTNVQIVAKSLPPVGCVTIISISILSQLDVGR